MGAAKGSRGKQGAEKAAEGNSDRLFLLGRIRKGISNDASGQRPDLWVVPLSCGGSGQCAVEAEGAGGGHDDADEGQQAVGVDALGNGCSEGSGEHAAD